MIPGLNSFNGHLPPGRWPCTLTEVEETFVHGLDPVRASHWNDFTNALDLLKTAAPVSRVWLGGSFISGKEQPGDVDAVFFVRYKHVVIAQKDPEKARILDAFTLGHGFREVTGLQVDTFVITWALDPPGEGGNEAVGNYYFRRGQWDDFWERCRSGAKNAPPIEPDAYQRRGYLEVKIDGNV